jgi:hypothetical protein
MKKKYLKIFIKDNYLNNKCDSSTETRTISNNLILISLSSIFSFISNNVERQKKLLESDFINIILPLIINSSSPNLKQYILNFISLLLKDKTNTENLIYEQNLLEYLKPILILLYDKIKITIEKYNSTSFLNDKIKIYVSDNIIRLLNTSETPIVNICFKKIFQNFYNMKEVIACSFSFSYFEGLKYLLLSLSRFCSCGQSFDIFSFFDLIVVVSNSFELLKKLMKTSFSDIILQTLNVRNDGLFT